jgi:hypothetical protein
MSLLSPTYNSNVKTDKKNQKKTKEKATSNEVASTLYILGS